jgi:putative protease
VKLRDRVGAEHVLKADAGCRNTVFNARAQTGAEYATHMQSLGARKFRIEFVDETPAQVKDAIAKYDQLLKGQISGEQVWRDLRAVNQLGVTRGQLGTNR